MRQITYISTARLRDGETLAMIERYAVQRNSREDLSGLLLYDGVRFLQVIEGPESAVAAAFERISADPRHIALVVLRDRTVDYRSFGGWAMLCRAPDQIDGGLAKLVTAFVRTADPSTRGLFESFAQIRSAKAA
jgi:hypothetical protein